MNGSSRGRRTLNIVVAILGLILAAPALLLLALAVRLSSSGPVIYSQERVGLERRRRDGDRRSRSRGGPDRRQSDAGGKIFRMHKFRTMYVNGTSNGNGIRNENDNGNGVREKQVWAAKDDPRITSVGRVLRAFRLDELPQLVHVLVGDMNIVGPRPEQPEIFHELRQEIAEYPKRQCVLPGITGLAQVNRGYDRCVEDVRRKLNHDLDYLKTTSVGRDLKIMLKTIPVMLFKKGDLSGRVADDGETKRRLS